MNRSVSTFPYPCPPVSTRFAVGDRCGNCGIGDVDSMIGCPSRIRLAIGEPFLRSQTILKVLILSATILGSVKNLRTLVPYISVAPSNVKVYHKYETSAIM